MKSFAVRRTIGTTICVIAAVILLATWTLAQGTLIRGDFASGWLLVGMIVFLALYNVRKALPFLPLGSSRMWLQLHIYVGLMTSFVFAVHVNFRIPNGMFECLLALTYLLVFFSGIIGLWMTRTFPKRLAGLGQEVIYESVPILIRQLRTRIEELLLPTDDSSSTALAEFYRDHILPFLEDGGRRLTYLMSGTNPDYQRLSRAIADQTRYLNDDEKQQLAEAEKLVIRQNQINTQASLQFALKVWLFVHIPATWVLLIFAFFHSMLVHAWSGGLS